ncbi:single-stranded DNA-binding protein [Metamycoplasma hyosynoviae]|nr:single-stranded DNA-binding protein [Metamycoplasma hyosynoviae]KDE43547.1 hypothetical protein NPL1_00365 [Metamycoplasma hyosynoviae]MDC8900536.1 single-stranded DNA-binding protein [Metamycoplasma hyosynoviae]MDC8937949.1 single-stranded DNA-binding protein [Metamycoplasma hyosynoviae]MDD1366375.1 single-stranded DNA-binding protein [Metamycoplasma hyosynoviae]MDD1373880.1 single-stranded DNA-binding protein [Metamycoplasma hyosynoviae]
MINKVILSGRIYTIYPNKTLLNNVEYLDFIIVNNQNNSTKKPNYIQIRCYDNLVNYVKNFQKVGNFIEIEGKVDSYKTPENKWITKIIAKKIFCISATKNVTEKEDIIIKLKDENKQLLLELNKLQNKPKNWDERNDLNDFLDQEWE